MAIGKKARSTSLVSPSGMGGIVGGGGYSYQDRYIACQIPFWLKDSSFASIWIEGYGDVDVTYGSPPSEHIEHIQVKDHQVHTKKEFQEVIGAFVDSDLNSAGVFAKYVLACPSLGGEVKSLAIALDRYRAAQIARSGTPQALGTTEADIRNRIAKLGLKTHSAFIFEKVYFDIGLCNYHDHDVARDFFANRVYDLPEFNDRVNDMLRPAFAPLIAEVVKHRGKHMDGTALRNVIASNVLLSLAASTAVNLDVHNWTVEKYDREPKHTIDWSGHFDRTSRRVPSSELWNDTLVPELHSLRQRLAKESSDRLIVFRGKCALTTGVALGAAFPKVDSWVFEIPQPPQPQAWRSDASPVVGYMVRTSEEIPVDGGGASIAVVLSVEGSALQQVQRFVAASKLPVKALVSIEPKNGARSLSIENDGEAVSYALAAKEVVKDLLQRHGVRELHLFYYGPFALSVFVGQSFTSVGKVHLYEFDNQSYVPSAVIMT